MMTWTLVMLANRRTLANFLMIVLSLSLEMFGPGEVVVGGGERCLRQSLWPLPGTRCLTLVPNSVIRGRKKPPFLRLLGTVQGLFSQDHEHRLFELSLLRSDFSCLCSKKGVIQLESCCHFTRQQTISAKFVTPGKFSEEVTHVANGDCGVIGWPMTECFL